MLSAYHVAREIASALPESAWSEVNRRLRAEPAALEVCQQPGVLSALLERPNAANADLWCPVAIGLGALAALEPDAAPEAHRWLTDTTDGRERLNDARALLFSNDDKTSGSTHSAEPLVSAAAAAVALQNELAQSEEIRARIVESAVEAPSLWRLPLTCLYGLLPKDDLLGAELLEAGASEVGETVLHIWQANETNDALRILVERTVAGLTPRAQLWLAQALRVRGLHELLPVVGQRVSDLPQTHPIDDAELPIAAQALAATTEAGLLALESGQEDAFTEFSDALQAAQSLASGMALRLGEAALTAGDAVSALAAFEQAERFSVDDREASIGTAEARTMLGQTADALDVLARAHDESPRGHLALAQAQLAAGDVELATQTASGCISGADSVNQLDKCANILSVGGAHEDAAAALEKAALLSQSPEGLLVRQSRELLASGRIQDAREVAFQALALKTDGADNHVAMARALEAHDAVMSPDYEGALVHWERSVELRSDHTDYHIGLGRCALNGGEPARTREVCSKLLEMHQIDANATSSERATTGEVYALLAQSMLALGEHEAAGEHFQKATQLAPQCSEPWRAIAAFHKNRGELDRARSALETGLQNVGSDDKGSKAVLLTDVARLQLQLEETDAAIESLRQASALRPTDGEIHFQLGEALLAQGDHISAVEALKRAAANLPADASVWHALGQAQQGAGDSAEALEALQRAQASGMHSKELAAQTGRLALELNKFDLARSNLETVAKEDGAEVSTLCAYASTLEQAEDWHSALDVYKRAIQLQPENNELIARLGACCLELGKTEAAMAALAPAAESNPDDLALQQTAAKAYAQAKMWADALPVFERVVRLAPDDVSALKQAALASVNTGDRQHAIELLHRAAALEPENADVHAHLAHVYAGDERWEEARDTITAAIDLNDRDEDFYHQLGEYHSALGDSDAALSAFFRATEIDPENATMLEALAEAQFQTEKFHAAHSTFLRAANALQIPTEEGLETEVDLVRRFSILGRAGDALVAQQQEPQAIALWQKALLEDPTDALLQKKLGEALLRQGRCEEASAAYENAIRADHADADALLGAAEAAMALGEEIRARHHVEKLEHSLDSPLMACRLGILCRQLGQFESALFAFRQAVALAPEQGVYRAMMARALAETGDRAAASDEADRALAAAPSDMVVLGNAGIALLQCERRSEALNCFRRVVASNETDCGTQFSVAKALVRAAELHRLYAVEDTQPEHERKLIADALKRARHLGTQTETAKEWLARAQILVGDVHAAIPTLEAIGGRVPTAEIHCALAAAHHLDGDHLKAQQAARWVLDRNPEHLSALLNLSKITAALGDFEGEITALERAITLAPDDAVPHYMLGQALLHRENHGAAKTAIARAVQLAPERADWHFRLGEVFRECDEQDAALSHFQTAAHLAEEQRLPAGVIAKYLATLARAHAADGDDTAAREQYEAALKLDNTQSEWYLEAANACMHQGDSAAALVRFEQAAQAKPNGIEPLVGGLKAAMAIGDTKQAERYALKALKQDPDNSSALTVLSELYSQRGDTENALVSLEHAVDNTSDKGPVLLAKAQVLADSRRGSEALAVLDDAMPHLKDDDRAWALVGALKDQDGDHEASITAYTRASELAPLNLEYHLRLGQLCRKEKQLDQALVHLNSAMKIQSSGAEAGAIQEELGKVFADRRQFDRAYKAFANAIKHTPTNAPLYFHAGVALKNLKDYGEAIAMFRKAVQMDPKNLNAHRQLAAVSALGLISGEASV